MMNRGTPILGNHHIPFYIFVTGPIPVVFVGFEGLRLGSGGWLWLFVLPIDRPVFPGGKNH